MTPNKHRTWAEIDLQAIEHNYEVICEKSKAPVLCVVKADAYGHGAVQVAKKLEPIAPYFAVATLAEAMELRESGIKKPILLLGFLAKEDMHLAIQNEITVTVYDESVAYALSKAASEQGKTVAVHYKLDTGMTRLGFAAWEAETIEKILTVSKLPFLHSEGIFTHFAVADTADGADYTKMQYDRFTDICQVLQEQGLALRLKHCANSGALQQYENTHMTMTRAGIILYGYRSDASVAPMLDLKPAMTVKTRVIQVRDIPETTSVSYGRTYSTKQKSQIAVIAMGYADGLHRFASGKGQVLIDGKKADILGRICMDMCMVEVPQGTALSAGDEVVVFGAEKLTADDLAQAAGTISYEVLCAVSKRVPRFYAQMD